MSTQDIYSTQAPQSNQSSSNGNGGRYTQPPYYQPMYYQQEPQVGCGTYLFRFAVFLIVMGVCSFFGLVLLFAVAGAASKTMQEAAFSETSLTEKFISGDKTAKRKVAVIVIEGVISGAEDGFIAKQIRQVLKDENVEAVVLRVESPGGTMSGSDYYHHLLVNMKEEREIPVVVSMGSIAASGGYYVSMVGDEIYAEHSTITGSIGVIVSLFNAADLCKNIGFESTPITSGPLKAMGGLTKRMSDEEKEVWQRLVDDSFKRFKQVIRDGRKPFANDPEKLDKLATGQIYTATEAKENGLIDEIGFLDDAIEKARNLAGLSESNSKAIRYKAKMSFMDALLESRAGQKTLGVETLVDATTPRVYLLSPYVLPVGE